MAEGTETRWLYDYHRGRIEELFATQPDLPLHQDTVAGFVQGYLITGAYFVRDDSVEQQSMGSALGGAVLLGQALPIVDTVEVTAGRGFIERATLAISDLPESVDAFTDVVRKSFVMVPDVPMSYASLGGFCLGVLYATPYLTGSDAGPTALITAACELARDLPC